MDLFDISTLAQVAKCGEFLRVWDIMENVLNVYSTTNCFHVLFYFFSTNLSCVTFPPKNV